MSKEPEYQTQKDGYGQDETIDVTVYSWIVICNECEGFRYVKPQDRSQVELCKPCARKARLKARAERAKKYRKRDKGISE